MLMAPAEELQAKNDMSNQLIFNQYEEPASIEAAKDKKKSKNDMLPPSGPKGPR